MVVAAAVAAVLNAVADFGKTGENELGIYCDNAAVLVGLGVVGAALMTVPERHNDESNFRRCLPLPLASCNNQSFLK